MPAAAITIEYIGDEPSASDLRTLITNELLSYYSKAVNGESTKVEITRFNDRTQEVTAEVTKTNEGVSTEKWTYTFVNDDADEAANDANWGVTDSGANYTPNGSWDVSGNVITATGFNNTTESMNDIARFLGALYRTSGAEEIRYDGKVYKWNKAGTLKGSNWTENGDPMVPNTNTLVSAI